MTQEEIMETKRQALQLIADEEYGEADDEVLFNQCVSAGINVIEANKRYPRHPFLMGRLAEHLGEEGYRQLRIVYPLIPGYPDPEEVAKWLRGGKKVILMTNCKNKKACCLKEDNKSSKESRKKTS